MVTDTSTRFDKSDAIAQPSLVLSFTQMLNVLLVLGTPFGMHRVVLIW